MWSRASKLGTLLIMVCLVQVIASACGYSSESVSPVVSPRIEVPATAASNPLDTPTPAHLVELSWSNDLRLLADALVQSCGVADADALDRAVLGLQTTLYAKSDAEIAIDFLRLTAEFGGREATLNLTEHPSFLGRYPLQVALFDDGFYVVAAASDLQHLVGSRLVAMDHHPIDEVVEQLYGVLSDPPSSYEYNRVPNLLMNPGVLAGLGIVAAHTDPVFDFEWFDGTLYSIRLHVLEDFGAVQMHQDLPARTLNLVPSRNYTYSLDGARDLLVLQHNRSEPQMELPFDTFLQDLFLSFDTHPVSTFVVDLRDNPGGYADQGELLQAYLARRSLRLSSGHLIVLVGPDTLGAAVDYAAHLQDRLGALVIGPPGIMASQWGRSMTIVHLPYSGLSLACGPALNADPLLAMDAVLLPDATSLRDGRDAMLEAALSYVEALPLDDTGPEPVLPVSSPDIIRPTRAERWREDVQAVVDQMTYLSVEFGDPFTVTAASEYSQRVESLVQAIPNLEDHKIVLGISSLLAMARDAHTRVPVWRWSHFADSRYPIRVQWFDSSLYVTAVQPGFDALLGRSVIAIGVSPVATVFESVSPFISSENIYGLRVASEPWLVNPAILHAIGASSDLKSASFTLADSAGVRDTVALPAIAADVLTEAWVSAATASVPLWQREPEGVYYWYTLLEQSNTLYFQMNACDELPDQPYEGFLDGMFDTAKASDVDRLIIDLRRNVGGYSQYLAPLLIRLRASELSQEGHLYVLIGPRTFSAAVFLAGLLREQTGAIFIGEPVGQGLPFYASVEEHRLPNSGILVHYPTSLWSVDGEPIRVFRPDKEILLTFEDYLAGRDPVLQAALSYP